MDKAEARSILADRLESLRATPKELVEGPSGTTYQVESSAFRDGGRRGNVRVAVAIDDGGRRFVPLTGSFIVAPDGSFVGD